MILVYILYIFSYIYRKYDKYEWPQNIQNLLMGAWQQNTHDIFQHNCKQTAIVMEKSSKPHELIHLIVPFRSAMMEENH